MGRFIQSLSISTFILLFIVSCTREPISFSTEKPYRPYDSDCGPCSYNYLCDGAFFQYRRDYTKPGSSTIIKKDTLTYYLTKLSDKIINDNFVYSLYTRTDVPIYDTSVLADANPGGFLSKHHVDSFYISCFDALKNGVSIGGVLRQIDKPTLNVTTSFNTNEVNKVWSDVFFPNTSPISRIDYKNIRKQQTITTNINGVKQIYNTILVVNQKKYDNTRSTPKLISNDTFYYSKFNGLIESYIKTDTLIIHQYLLSKPKIPNYNN